MDPDLKAFIECPLDENTIRQNVARVNPPGNRAPAVPITTEAVETAASKLATGSFDILKQILAS